jgi:hypothetical protein
VECVPSVTFSRLQTVEGCLQEHTTALLYSAKHAYVTGTRAAMERQGACRQTYPERPFHPKSQRNGPTRSECNCFLQCYWIFRYHENELKQTCGQLLDHSALICLLVVLIGSIFLASRKTIEPKSMYMVWEGMKIRRRFVITVNSYSGMCMPQRPSLPLIT